ncbi:MULTISPECIES: hypothetical protein [unclassified Streptomyces]|uniref:hypothetical protein n=1 Tax=unclassified Streptomyces TaxID=2593676 RepID=UPI000DBA49E2|nr:MULTISPECIES: hypothetical protein [unclassified Streptomyces]MYT70710.1 hypothetical protein [Streptomyces sp. SID8367]RAJ90416.1 hypothetical protein K377_01041 [Streptomyces sp. PsTaAH-137]
MTDAATCIAPCTLVVVIYVFVVVLHADTGLRTKWLTLRDDLAALTSLAALFIPQAGYGRC